MFKDVDIKFVNKEITPFGGLSLFFKMLEKCGYDKVLQECGLPEQGSNRGYKPWQLVMGLFAGVWCGACKFGHLDLVRHDRVLSKMVGWDIVARHRAYQRYFNKFTQATNQKVFGYQYKWFFDNLVFDNYTLDFDSTVMVREGEQYGAASRNSLFRHALINSPKKSFLKTIRYEFVNTPAYFSKSMDKHVLYLARSLKTRSAF